MAKTNLDSLQLDDSALYDGDGNQILAGRGVNIVAATDAASALTRINLVIAELKRHGLIASS